MSDVTVKVLPRMVFQFDPQEPRCKVNVNYLTTEGGRGRNKKLGQACASFAKIEIDGVPMCLRHAQQEALRILLKQKNTTNLNQRVRELEKCIRDFLHAASIANIDLGGFDQVIKDAENLII